ncbi:hypothetical protein [Paracoccus laeviglucosivorans]|uniref:Sulfotransferase family protein n=1 Tax=Paracoccus laeviglucosivorans TaxID=1197861 RepID=A0A521ERW9_9RHOB|nr:hypothetical protein [Paracoccus laeviglucosivorans]SMO86647.1 hypothetical protein SAMN06265221_11520 [Paracoccus laeviglucosivorans]
MTSETVTPPADTAASPRGLLHPRTVRRLRIYSGRARAVARGLKHPCLFLHMPKCGGTSLSEALYGTVPLHKTVAVLDAISTRRAAAIQTFDRDEEALCHDDLEHGDITFNLREQLMLTHMAAGAQLIHGHVLYSAAMERHFGARYRITSVMRDPVSRAISNFSMMAGNGYVSSDVDAWLDGPVGRSHATVFLRYLGGKNVVTAEEEPAVLELALERLKNIAVLGFLNDMPKYLDRFADEFGVKPQVHRYNQAAWPTISLNAAQRSRLEQACAADMAIYDAARRQFG